MRTAGLRSTAAVTAAAAAAYLMELVERFHGRILWKCHLVKYFDLQGVRSEKA